MHVGGLPKASAAGKGWPDDAIKKLEIALAAITRICKQGQANIVVLKTAPPSAMMATGRSGPHVPIGEGLGCLTSVMVVGQPLISQTQ